jgi:hypothetical protein
MPCSRRQTVERAALTGSDGDGCLNSRMYRLTGAEAPWAPS